MNLIPFKFEQFQTTEAVWNVDIREQVKRFRFTRKAIGDFLYPGHKNPQNAIDKILYRYPELKGLSIPAKLAGTLPVTVTGKTGQEFQAETYDIWGIYKIARASRAPMRDAFLDRFPDFLLALQSGKIRPALPPTEKQLIAMDRFKEIDETPRGHKMDAYQKLAEQLDRGVSTVCRWKKALREQGRIQYKYNDGAIQRLKRERFPLWKAVMDEHANGKTPAQISRKLKVSRSVISKVINVYAPKYGDLLYACNG